MVTRTQLVAEILSRQLQQRERKPVFSIGQGIANLGADFLTKRALEKAEAEKRTQTTSANEAIARALQTATGGVPSFQDPDDPTQQLVPPVQGGTPQALAAALSGLTGPGTEDIRNQLGTLAIGQQFKQRQAEAKAASDLALVRERQRSGADIPASIREFDTLVETADLSQEETETAARIRLKLTAGAGNLTVDEKLFLAQAKSGLKVEETKQLSQVQREEGFIDNAFGAAGEIQDINRAFELLETVETGGLVAATKAVTDFFGTTPGDVGELNNLLATNVLNGLAAFTGAISEGERAFLEGMSTSLSQGGQVNKAQLRRLKRIASNSIRNGKRILNRRAEGGDENAINALADFTAVLEQGKPEQAQGTPTGRFNDAGEQLFQLLDGSFVARK